MNKIEQTIEKVYELKRLYLDEKKTTREIGDVFGTSKHTIEIAMERLGIKRRQTRTKGTKPSREFLKHAIFEDNRSLSDIAKELGCDAGSIKLWAKEYGIVIPVFNNWSQRNKQRGYKRPSKKVLNDLYNIQGYSLRNIADEFGVSRQAISDAFKHHKIELNYSGWNQSRLTCKDGHIVKSLYEQRVDDWLFDHGFDHEYEPVLPFSNRGHSDFLVGDTYIEIFGVSDSKIYEERKKQKTELYKNHGCKLIAINHWDFSKQKNDLWKRKLDHLKSSVKA